MMRQDSSWRHRSTRRPGTPKPLPGWWNAEQSQTFGDTACHPEPFAALRVNSAKGLARRTERSFAALRMTARTPLKECHPERMSRSPEPFASLKGKLREGEG